MIYLGLLRQLHYDTKFIHHKIILDLEYVMLKDGSVVQIVKGCTNPSIKPDADLTPEERDHLAALNALNFFSAQLPYK